MLWGKKANIWTNQKNYVKQQKIQINDKTLKNQLLRRIKKQENSGEPSKPN